METSWPYILGAIAAAMTGLLVYVATRKRDTVDERAKLFDDALQLAEAHKDAWEKATAEVEELRCEIAELRQEIVSLRDSVHQAIREGEMWRGVAVDIAKEFKQETGRFPLAWPDNEPLPAAS